MSSYTEVTADPDAWRTPGGSLQAVLTRWTRDDGAVFVGDTMTLAEIDTVNGRRSVMFQACRPDPDLDTFIIGADTISDEHGLLGASHTATPAPADRRFRTEFWSSNVQHGAVVGYWHWVLADVTDVHWTGVHLTGSDPALMTYTGTANLPLSYQLVERLPDYEHGTTAPTTSGDDQ